MAIQIADKKPRSEPHSPNWVRLFWIVTALFLLSGANGLIYQIVWMRELALFFGNDTYSSSITLSAFFGGLALGGWLISSVADRLRNHLIWYGILELLIAVLGLLVHSLLASLHPAVSWSYQVFYETTPLFHQLIRIGIAVAVLLVPTTMMGATFPLIVRAMTRKIDGLGEVSGHFYAANTFGAVAGVLFGGLVLLPSLGVRSTTIVAVVSSAVVGFAALAIAGWRRARIGVELNQAETLVALNSGRDGSSSSGRKSGSRANAALIGIGLSGLGALALEVIWTTILVQSFSGTAYSFSIMLISVLTGIAVGSRVVSGILDEHEAPLRLLGWLEIGVAFSIAILSALSFLAPKLFGLFVWGISSISSGLFGLASITATLIVSIFFLLIPTSLLGAALPTALKAFNRSMVSVGRDAGLIVSVNTLGGIVGSLVAGFVLIPIIGARYSLILLSIFFLANGIYILSHALSSFGLTLREAAPASILIAVPLLFVSLSPRQTTLNYDIQQDDRPEVLFHDEGLAGFVDVVRTPSGDKALFLNGNIEADTSLLQRRHFILKGHLPLMASEEPSSILVVGLGMGITANALARHPGVENVDVIEISPDIIDAQSVLVEENDDVLSNPRVNVAVDDGRNYLSYTEKKYDLITADPVHPRITGVGYLYTVEYYELIRDQLAEDGVVLQWMPMYGISPKSFEVAVRSFETVFPGAALWYVPGHALLIAEKGGEADIRYETLMERMSDPEVQIDLASIGFAEPVKFASHMLLSSSAVDAYLKDGHNRIVNTDDNAYLEYHVPHEYLWGPDAILEQLIPYAEFDPSFLNQAPVSFLQSLEVAYSERLGKLTDELYDEGILRENLSSD